jgi:hypothetical protein
MVCPQGRSSALLERDICTFSSSARYSAADLWDGEGMRAILLPCRAREIALVGNLATACIPSNAIPRNKCVDVTYKKNQCLSPVYLVDLTCFCLRRPQLNL